MSREAQVSRGKHQVTAESGDSSDTVLAQESAKKAPCLGHHLGDGVGEEEGSNYSNRQRNWCDPFHMDAGTTKVMFYIFLKLALLWLRTCQDKQEICLFLSLAPWSGQGPWSLSSPLSSVCSRNILVSLSWRNPLAHPKNTSLLLFID